MDLKTELALKLTRGNGGSSESDFRAISEAFGPFFKAAGGLDPTDSLKDLSVRFAFFVLCSFHGSTKSRPAAEPSKETALTEVFKAWNNYPYGPDAYVDEKKAALLKQWPRLHAAIEILIETHTAKFAPDFGLTKVNNSETDFSIYQGGRKGGKSFADADFPRSQLCAKCGETLFEHGGHPFEFPSKVRCNRPPAGWECSRELAHAGPCAASPSDSDAWHKSAGDVKFHADDYPANIGDCQSPPAASIRDEFPPDLNRKPSRRNDDDDRRPDRSDPDLDRYYADRVPAPGVVYYDDDVVKVGARHCSNCLRYFTGPAKLDAQNTFCGDECQNEFFAKGDKATPAVTLSPAADPEQCVRCLKPLGDAPIDVPNDGPGYAAGKYCSIECLAYKSDV